MANRLWIWVEGDDDERFFNRVVKPRLRRQFSDCIVRRWANQKKDNICGLISGLLENQDEYIFISDSKGSTCKAGKKNDLLSVYSCLNPSKIILVVKDIEAWYLAGVKADFCAQYGIIDPTCTDIITKGRFEKLKPRAFDSIKDFKIEIIKSYDLANAIKKNQSLAYFANKFNLAI